MTTISMPRTEPVIPRRLLSEQAIFALMVWAGFSLFIFVLTFAVSLVRDIDVSGWNLAGQPARWFGFAIGIYVGYSLFPLYVTHGGTRKGYTAQVLSFALAYGGLLGVLFTLTFPIEAGYYALMGWPQALHGAELYAHPLDLPVVLVQWVVIMVLWVMGGIFMGATWYRSAVYGTLAIIFGIFLVGLSGMAIGAGDGPFEWAYRQLLGSDRLGTFAAIVLHLVAIAILGLLTWAAVRDAPIHNKSE